MLRGVEVRGVEVGAYLLHLGSEQIGDEDRLRVLELDALDQRVRVRGS